MCSFILYGCYDNSISKVPTDTKSYSNLSEFDKQRIMAGIGSVRNLDFFKLITKEDKILLEENLQIALEQNDWREWQGDSMRCNIKIGQETIENCFVCREFTQTFFFLDKFYKVTNKACKVGMNKDGSNGCWILASSLKYYLNR
jgi:hypothetical protein